MVWASSDIIKFMSVTLVKPAIASYASNSRNPRANHNVVTLLSLLNLMVLFNLPCFHLKVHVS